MKIHKQIIEKLIEYIEREKEIDEITEKYFNVIAPSSHTPIPDDSLTTAYLDWIKMFNTELYDLLSRWIWDCDMNGKIVTAIWETYYITNKEELLIYIEENLT